MPESSGGESPPEIEEIREALRDASRIKSFRELADETGVSHTTIQKVINGHSPSKRTIRKLRKWKESEITRAGDSSVGSFPSSLGRSNGSPAERLIYYFSHPELARQLPLDSPMDFVKAAFAIALEQDFPAEELEKLSRWRENIREAEEGAP